MKRFAKDARVLLWDLYNEPNQVASEQWILPKVTPPAGCTEARASKSIFLAFDFRSLNQFSTSGVVG